MKQLLVYLYDTCVITEVSLLTWWVNEEEDYEVKTISESLELIKTLEGLIMKPEMKIVDVIYFKNIVGIVFPGGEEISLSKPLNKLINRLHNEGKILGAICAGPTFLAYSGILQNKKYTTTRKTQHFKDLGVPDPFEWKNKQPEEVRVVRDGNIVTATGSAFTDFADVMFDALNLYQGLEDRKAILGDFTPKWKF